MEKVDALMLWKTVGEEVDVVTQVVEGKKKRDCFHNHTALHRARGHHMFNHFWVQCNATE